MLEIVNKIFYKPTYILDYLFALVTKISCFVKKSRVIKYSTNIISLLGHNKIEVIKMSKQGMKRPENTENQPHNNIAAVPEIQGKAKHGKTHVRAIIAGTRPPKQKVYHSVPYSLKNTNSESEKPISEAYPVVDNDLARDNMENDIPAADLQDL